VSSASGRVERTKVTATTRQMATQLFVRSLRRQRGTSVVRVARPPRRPRSLKKLNLSSCYHAAHDCVNRLRAAAAAGRQDHRLGKARGPCLATRGLLREARSQAPHYPLQVLDGRVPKACERTCVVAGSGPMCGVVARGGRARLLAWLFEAERVHKKCTALLPLGWRVRPLSLNLVVVPDWRVLCWCDL